MAKSLMIQGTMSNAGKSLITAGLLRIFRQDGYSAAPFKSQNMALNSYITKEGLEMGRAQVVQAEAAKIVPRAIMNPILLKPTSNMGSQVIINGSSIGTMAAKDYFAFKKSLIPVIREAYEILEREYDIIVIEGAGSPAEINLKKDDIVNMGMARMAKAPVLLVGDIDRGGVFAQLYGTMMLLSKEERSMVKGLIVNKFRGDKTILDPGTRMLEKLCGSPVLGVVPYLGVTIEEEDSQDISSQGQRGLIDVAVVRLPKISNFTDFQPLAVRPDFNVRYVEQPGDFDFYSPDLIILPGTKNTIADLLWLRQIGMEAAILKLAAREVPVFGICGGYQMMGKRLWDPENVEGSGVTQPVAGLNLLSLETRFGGKKERTRVRGRLEKLEGVLSSLSGMEVEGYEIHMGVSHTREKAFCHLNEYQEGAGAPKPDGCAAGSCYGTYVHGIFDEGNIAAALASCLKRAKGLGESACPALDYKAYKEEQYDLLAKGLRESLDMERIYGILEEGTDIR